MRAGSGREACIRLPPHGRRPVRGDPGPWAPSKIPVSGSFACFGEDSQRPSGARLLVGPRSQGFATLHPGLFSPAPSGSGERRDPCRSGERRDPCGIGERRATCGSGERRAPCGIGKDGPTSEFVTLLNLSRVKFPAACGGVVHFFSAIYERINHLFSASDLVRKRISHKFSGSDWMRQFMRSGWGGLQRAKSGAGG